MKTFFKVGGTSDKAMDLSNSIVKKGVRSVQQSFNRHVGIGSREQCLLGAIIIECVTSSTVVNMKALSSIADVRGMMGDGVLAVEVRMLVTFSLKKFENSSAPKSLSTFVYSSPHTVLLDSKGLVDLDATNRFSFSSSWIFLIRLTFCSPTEWISNLLDWNPVTCSYTSSRADALLSFCLLINCKKISLTFVGGALR